jgi:arsenate reductase-like glutaredoxin family protein
MNIQIFGTKKCRDTQKTERYFKERRIPYHFVDLTERGLSKGELDKIKPPSARTTYWIGAAKNISG